MLRYKEIIDPNFRYTGFSVSEQDKILAAKRSNNELDATKLNEALSKVTFILHIGSTFPYIDADEYFLERLRQTLSLKCTRHIEIALNA